jgi:hypothetical protein
VLRRDLILRMIQDMALLMARLLGLRAKGLVPEAVAEVEAASSSLLGLDLRLVEALDPALLATQLSDPVRIDVLARLVNARADLCRDAGEAAAAAGWSRKAVELWLEAGAAGATLEEDALRAIAAFPPDGLGARQRRLRAALA